MKFRSLKYPKDELKFNKVILARISLCPLKNILKLIIGIKNRRKTVHRVKIFTTRPESKKILIFTTPFNKGHFRPGGVEKLFFTFIDVKLISKIARPSKYYR